MNDCPIETTGQQFALRNIAERRKSDLTKQKNNGANLGFERELWQAADALRSNMDAAEYKHVVLGLIFLKYISDAFEEQHAILDAERAQGADPEDPDEYRAVNIFWVPKEARWSNLKANAKQPTVGKTVDEAMLAIERDNPSLKGVLPKDYAHPRLDKQRLGQLIDMIGNIGLGDQENRSKDILGRVYEYFLSQFASAEGKKGGQFYTPRCVVRVLVEVLSPYKGRVYDPCCGSGGMFVQSVEFVKAHASGNGNGGKLELKESERPRIDPEFEEVTEGEEVESKEKLKTKWAQLEALVGAEKRVRLIAEDLVKHFEGRLEAMDGKAMIVCMSRRICVELYDAITALRPNWKQDHQNDQDQNHDDDDNDKHNNNPISIKIVMTGSASDPVEWQEHIRTKARRETLAKRFKDPKDPFKIVIVRDMWLTGFDAPCLHTMYMDKPMRSHGLMQAIARVNRVFKDKPGGLVVDYLGLAHELKSALANYTESGGQGQAVIDQDEAVIVMLEKFEICCGIFHGFEWSKWKSRDPQERLSILPAAQEHVLSQKNGKRRLSDAVVDLLNAFALSVPHEKALHIRDDVAFFQAMKAVMSKSISGERRSPDEIDHAIRQIVSKAVSSDEVIDIFAAAGLKKPDISILSDEFLAEVRGMPQRNLAVEMLRKLLDGEVKKRSRKNIVQGRSFAEMLENAIKRYQARAIEAAQVIEELIALAKDMREADRRGEELGLTEDEVAFYDALETNDSAVKVLGDETLRIIAQELLTTVRNNVTIDWTVRENVRAQMRVMIKRILRRYGYPPDRQARATELVLEQAEVLCKDWAE